MKKTAVILFVITLICAVLFGYHLLSSNLTADFSVKSVPAVVMDDLFYEVSSELDSQLTGIEDYAFMTVSVKARSFSPFPAEWVTFSVNEKPGDVIVISENAGPDDIDSLGKNEYSITLLTSDKDEVRSGILNYYILGHNHSLYLSNN